MLPASYNREKQNSVFSGFQHKKQNYILKQNYIFKQNSVISFDKPAVKNNSVLQFFYYSVFNTTFNTENRTQNRTEILFLTFCIILKTVLRTEILSHVLFFL